MDPVMQCTTLPSHSESLKIFLFHFSWRSTRFYRLSHSEIVDIEKVAVSSSLRSPNIKCALIDSMDGLDAMLENGLWFIRNNLLILKKWHLDENLLKEDVSIIPVWVKLHGVPIMAFSKDSLSDIATKLELKDTIVAAMPKITREGYYTCNIRVEYEWKPPRCACCKVFRHVLEECPKNIGVGATKNLKKTKSIKEVSMSNPFEVLTSIDNDVDFGKLRFVDDDRNPLVPMGIIDSDSEVKVVFDETANLRISTSGKEGSDKGYGTNSLLEQWRDSYLDNNDYDPYDDDMYENHDMFEHLQSIYDDLDITIPKGNDGIPLLQPTLEQSFFARYAKFFENRLTLQEASGSLTLHEVSGSNIRKDSSWLVPSCFVIFDLEPLSLSFDFVFSSEIFKSLSFRLDRLCHLAILCLDQHAHTLHHLESLLTISLDRHYIF
ncbi:zinc knuckle CX2CX4HX4C containing protein [Tanacetum coccineum]|uniref:Zinc knuckle CX2CX4HX4C containing protein n=1 Tax=Tanacetum coccineum TaxID=301880 RepID=A0ABQ4XQ35_9ASTR